MFSAIQLGGTGFDTNLKRRHQDDTHKAESRKKQKQSSSSLRGHEINKHLFRERNLATKVLNASRQCTSVEDRLSQINALIKKRLLEVEHMTNLRNEVQQRLSKEQNALAKVEESLKRVRKENHRLSRMSILNEKGSFSVLEYILEQRKPKLEGTHFYYTIRSASRVCRNLLDSICPPWWTRRPENSCVSTKDTQMFELRELLPDPQRCALKIGDIVSCLRFSRPYLSNVVRFGVSVTNVIQETKVMYPEFEQWADKQNVQFLCVVVGVATSRVYYAPYLGISPKRQSLFNILFIGHSLNNYRFNVNTWSCEKDFEQSRARLYKIQ
jgi:hypothetical protein